MRALSRRNIIAITVGVLFTGAVLAIFIVALNGLIDQRGRDEADLSAKRTIALANSSIARAVETVESLARLGVASCAQRDVGAMRHAVFETMQVKELALLDSSGQPLCVHYGLPIGKRSVVSSELLPGHADYSLDVLAFGEGRRMIRLRRKVGLAAREIAALVPSELLLPRASIDGDPSNVHIRIFTGQGAYVGSVGPPPETDSEQAFRSWASSRPFGLKAEVTLPRQQVVADHQQFERLGLLGAILTITVIVGSLVVARRRDADNPVAEFQRALRAGELVPYYQPVVDIHSGKLRGAEVLVRWRKPDGTLVLPGAFIPLAESSGLIRALTRNLMRRVSAEMGPVIGCRPSMKVAFNVSGKLLSSDAIVKDVRTTFANSQIKYSQVVLEVTERDPIENFTETRQMIAVLQGMGVRIAIDDVGTGHSGLSYMLKLGVDIIKIDKMFVDALWTDRNSTTIVETLVDLAHNMRMDIVAEGVENFEQVMHLREMGIRSAQGYVFAPPLPGSAFLKLIEAIDPLPEAEVPAAAPHYDAVRDRRHAA